MSVVKSPGTWRFTKWGAGDCSVKDAADEACLPVGARQNRKGPIQSPPDAPPPTRRGTICRVRMRPATGSGWGGESLDLSIVAELERNPEVVLAQLSHRLLQLVL